MLLAFDIGNTETTVGLFDRDTLLQRWRLTTHTPRTPDELCLILRRRPPPRVWAWIPTPHIPVSLSTASSSAPSFPQ
jgi:hypothetical protein